MDLSLCAEEKSFLVKRREKVKEGLNRLLGKDKGPQTTDEVRKESTVKTNLNFELAWRQVKLI